MFTARPTRRLGWFSLAAIRRGALRFMLVAVALGTVAFGTAACGGGSDADTSSHAPAAGRGTGSRPRGHDGSLGAGGDVRRRPVAERIVTLRYRRLYTLAAPLRDPAYAALGGDRFAMMGGLNGADVSVAGIEVADLHRVVETGALPGPQHDAQAARLAGKVYVFGGGFTTELDHILMYDPTRGQASPAGALSVPQSDVAVTQAGGVAYIVGGFDGTNYLNTIVAWRPGSRPAIVGHVPEGLRYAAATVAGSGLYVLGGVAPAGTSNAIYRFDLTTHRVRRIGTLPQATEHGNAVMLASTIYLVGGRGAGDSDQTAAVYAVDPLTGRVRPAGRLATPTSDAAVMTIGQAIVVAGGQSPTGTLAGVGELVPAAR